MADETKNAPVAGAPAPPAGTVAEVDEEKTQWVISTNPVKKDGGSVVALFEEDEAHPGGEAFVAGPKAVEVALTSAVVGKLASGEIRKATGAEVREAKTLAEKIADDAANATE